VKKTLAIVLALLLVLGMTGCASSKDKKEDTTAVGTSETKEDVTVTAEPEAPEAEVTTTGEGYVVALCNYSIGNSWRAQMEQEFVSECEELKGQGVVSDYYITNSNEDINKQISDMQDLITKKVDAIVITAASPTALAPVVEEATAAGIKVVSFDNIVETDAQVATVGIDEKEFGRINAEWLVEQLGGKGKIVVLNGIAGTACDATRWGGAEEVFNKYPDIEILATANASWDYAEGKAAAESMLSAYPEIDGVWSQGGAMTQGAIDAFIAADRKLVPMTSEGNNGAIRAWIENRENGLSCIAPSNPTYTSAEALRVAIKALNGEEVPSKVVMDLEVVTEENVDSYYREDMPDSFWVLTELDDDALVALYK
jgi:ribose transport system substrate-binding protein